MQKWTKRSRCRLDAGSCKLKELCNRWTYTDLLAGKFALLREKHAPAQYDKTDVKIRRALSPKNVFLQFCKRDLLVLYSFWRCVLNW